MQALYPGCVAPVKTVLVVTTEDADFDLSTVTGARINALFVDGRTASWDADLSAASATSLTLTREHIAADVPEGTEGVAYISGELDMPAASAAVITERAAVLVSKR